MTCGSNSVHGVTVFCFFEQKLDVFCRFLQSYKVVTTSKSIFKTTSSLSQIQQPKYGVIGVLWQNTSDVTRGEREIRFSVLFFKGLVQTRLSNESFAEFS